MFPISLLTVHGGISPSAASIAGWVYLVTFGSLLGFSAYVWLLANAPLGLVSTYAYVNPLVAITLGVIFRGEQLTWRLLIGAAVVIVAVATVVRQEPAVRQREPEPVAVD
jgi:drug/metabolite transporter (DMT)-like permease